VARSVSLEASRSQGYNTVAPRRRIRFVTVIGEYGLSKPDRADAPPPI
jgi:hypothetical protein